MSSAIPIRGNNDQSIPVQFHRNSFAHSQGMGGISWGGASVGSWLRDEVLMASKNKDQQAADNFLFTQDSNGQDNNQLNPDSTTSTALEDANSANRKIPDSLNQDFTDPLLDHAPTYFPSLEANFCRDYTCCDRLLPTLHDLLRHYEEQHISPSPPEEPPVMRRMQNIETVSTNDVFLPFDQPVVKEDDGIAGLAGLEGLNGDGFSGVPGIDDMDLDLEAPIASDASGAQIPAFAPPSFQPLTTNNLSQFNASSRSKGAGNTSINARAFQSNGMNSNGSGTSNNLGTNGSGGNSSLLASGRHSGLGGGMNHLGANSSNSSNGFGSGGFGNAFNSNGASSALSGSSRIPGAGMAFGDDEEPTIDDPARQLYMLERSENKPFKCPVIGCEKTYKNQNGLKYHRQHGHQNQTLHLNDDGTYSIIDPLSNTPYPDGMGMEKDKPYRCEICGKRYKNLNGLKYHRAHSTH